MSRDDVPSDGIEVDSQLEQFADRFLAEKLSQPISRASFVRRVGGGALALGAGSSLVGASLAGAATTATTIRIIDVAGYADPQVTAAWRKANDVKIVEQGTGSNEEIVAKLAAGGTKTYSLASPNIAYVANMVAANLLQPIDYSQIASAAKLLPFLKAKGVKALTVDGETYGFPFIWGASPMMVNAQHLKGPAPKGWNDLRQAKFKKRLFMIDDPTNNITVWSRALGFNPQRLTKDQLKQVISFLVGFKKSQVRAFGGTWTDVQNTFISGDILAVASGGWSAIPGFINKAGGNAIAVYAREGDFVWTDTWAIPKDAPNADLALSFINYMTSAPAQAVLAKKLLSGTVNAAAVNRLSAADKKLNNYKNPIQVSKGFLYLPPPKTSGNQASLNDWYKAWQTVKAA